MLRYLLSLTMSLGAGPKQPGCSQQPGCFQTMASLSVQEMRGITGARTR